MALTSIKEPFAHGPFQYIVEVSFQLDAFYRYIDITEKTIDKEIELLKSMCEEEIECGCGWENYEITINTRNLFYNSLFTSLYSFLERKMYQLCRLAEKNQNIKINDLSGNGIFKYHKYLEKIIHIDFQKINTEWGEIIKYNKLRNLIVHKPTTEIINNKENSKLIKDLKSIAYLFFIDKGDIIEFQIKDKQLFFNFCKTIDRLLNEIYCENSQTRCNN